MEVSLGRPLDRLAAHLIDSAMIGVPLGLGLIAFAGFPGSPAALAVSALGLLLTIVACVLQLVGVARRGQSIAKRVMTLQLKTDEGKLPGLPRVVVLRNLIPTFLSALPFGAGILFTVVDALLIFRTGHRTLHDVFAKTKVIALAEVPRSKRIAMLIVGGALTFASQLPVMTFRSYEVDGPSMEPTLVHRDRFLVAGLDGFVDPRRGDVIVLRSPADGADILKRVIGLPGDRVEITAEHVLVNGARLPRRHLRDVEGGAVYEERIARATGPEKVYEIMFQTRARPRAEREVPPGHIYVLGDHRDRSNDSTNPLIGSVPIDQVHGVATGTFYSATREWRRPL